MQITASEAILLYQQESVAGWSYVADVEAADGDRWVVVRPGPWHDMWAYAYSPSVDGLPDAFPWETKDMIALFKVKEVLVMQVEYERSEDG